MKILVSSEYVDYVHDLIFNSTKSIDICMYDWRWYRDHLENRMQKINIALVAAARRGIRVRALVNSSVNAEFLKEMGIRARYPKSKKTLHAKFIIIDEKILVMGSHNFTSNAFNSNHETSVVVELPEDEVRLKSFFEFLYGF